jgi:hypothetical protein
VQVENGTPIKKEFQYARPPHFRSYMQSCLLGYWVHSVHAGLMSHEHVHQFDTVSNNRQMQGSCTVKKTSCYTANFRKQHFTVRISPSRKERASDLEPCFGSTGDHECRITEGITLVDPSPVVKKYFDEIVTAGMNCGHKERFIVQISVWIPSRFKVKGQPLGIALLYCVQRSHFMNMQCLLVQTTFNIIIGRVVDT